MTAFDGRSVGRHDLWVASPRRMRKFHFDSHVVAVNHLRQSVVRTSSELGVGWQCVDIMEYDRELGAWESNELVELRV